MRTINRGLRRSRDAAAHEIREIHECVSAQM
jgi:hypothetical protein